MQKAAKIKKKAVCRLFFLNAIVCFTFGYFCCLCFLWSLCILECCVSHCGSPSSCSFLFLLILKCSWPLEWERLVGFIRDLPIFAGLVGFIREFPTFLLNNSSFPLWLSIPVKWFFLWGGDFVVVLVVLLSLDKHHIFLLQEFISIWHTLLLFGGEAAKTGVATRYSLLFTIY